MVCICRLVLQSSPEIRRGIYHEGESSKLSNSETVKMGMEE